MAKRALGKIERDQKKIAQLLGEIQQCVQSNKIEQGSIIEAKANERVARREGQLGKLAKKKKKFATDLVTKLNKAKKRGRQRKTAKMQLPRKSYYKSPNMWPSSKPPKIPTNKPNSRPPRPHSYYSHYNDPYYTRYHYWYPYYHHYGYYDEGTFGGDGAENDESLEGTEANNAALGEMLLDVDGTLPSDPDDPWSNVDALIGQVDSGYGNITSPEYLAAIHEECSELGPDVVNDICGALDSGAALNDKVVEISEATNAPPQMLTDVIDADPVDVAALESGLGDIPDFEADDDVAGADDAVAMYAGAGPQDLDDGGPSFGDSSHAVLAGARRRARSRKAGRTMRRVREKRTSCSRLGYRNVDLIAGNHLKDRLSLPESCWPSDLVGSWVEETRAQQIKAIAECNLFDLPYVSSMPTTTLRLLSPDIARACGIEVVLVTQCSMDRLENLKEQLTCWGGKASVAIYLKPGECKFDAASDILSVVEQARHNIEMSSKSYEHFDASITLVEGCIDDEPYPINFLRNVALLQAREQHLRFNASLDGSAVLLGKLFFFSFFDRPETSASAFQL